METEPFFEATKEGRLVLPRCDACGHVIWYPRLFCPSCGSQSVSWIDASGRGVVYSYTVTRRGQGAYREAAPYVLAYVELDEGPRVLTNVVGCDPSSVTVGMAVTAVFDQSESGPALLRFAPA
jgi:uncharacterized OB-fold protein